MVGGGLYCFDHVHLSVDIKLCIKCFVENPEVGRPVDFGPISGCTLISKTVPA